MVDLEAQLALDEGVDEATLRSRDRSLYLGLTPPPTRVEALLPAWLDVLRERFGAPRAGERLALAQRILGYVLVVSGLLSGWGVAEVLLRFEQGGAPVNVGYYLLVLVFGQIATLALLLLGLALHRIFPQLPLVGDTVRVLRFASSRLQRYLHERHPSAAERMEAERAVYRRLRTRLGLYERMERYLLLRLSQSFAVAFNVGALASCLRLIVFSDLAFAWSTSLTSFDAADVHRLCTLLALPFGWLVPDAVPSASLIEHTQYFRLEGRFAGAAAGTRGDPALAGEWWRFLVACTITYGLVPRMLALGMFMRGYRKAEREVPLDTPAVQRVVTRMTTPEVSTRAPELIAQAAPPAKAVEPLLKTESARTTLLVYRDIPTAPALLERAVSQRLGLAIDGVHRVGGLDVREDAALCEELSKNRTSVTLIAEAWEAPDKSLRALLAALRTALGPRRALRVVLIGEASQNGFDAPSPADVRVYRDRLTLLEDAYLAVETLPESGAPEAADDEARA